MIQIQVRARIVALGCIEDFARVPLSFPTYAGILGRAAAMAARHLSPEMARSRFADVL